MQSRWPATSLDAVPAAVVFDDSGPRPCGPLAVVVTGQWIQESRKQYLFWAFTGLRAASRSKLWGRMAHGRNSLAAAFAALAGVRPQPGRNGAFVGRPGWPFRGNVKISQGKSVIGRKRVWWRRHPDDAGGPQGGFREETYGRWPAVGYLRIRRRGGSELLPDVAAFFQYARSQPGGGDEQRVRVRAGRSCRGIRGVHGADGAAATVDCGGLSDIREACCATRSDSCQLALYDCRATVGSLEHPIHPVAPYGGMRFAYSALQFGSLPSASLPTRDSCRRRRSPGWNPGRRCRAGGR